MSFDSKISARIELARMLMICGVAYLHAPPYVPLADIPLEPFAMFKAFFAHGVFRATTPVLTFISGYLCFARGVDFAISDHVRKKVRTLLIPLALWNIPIVVLILALRSLHFNFGPLDYVSAQFDNLWNILNLTFGITTAPVNVPMGFVRDLFVVQMLAPVFAIFLRRAPVAGLALVAVVFLNDLDGPLVLRNVIPIVFYMGGMAAVGRWNAFALDRFRAPALSAFVIWVAALVFLRSENRILLSIAAPFLIWPALSYLENTGFARWARAHGDSTFIIFAAQHFFLATSWHAFHILGLRDTSALYPLYWLAAPAVTILVCVASTEHFIHFVPLLTGRDIRAAKPARARGPIPA